MYFKTSLRRGANGCQRWTKNWDNLLSTMEKGTAKENKQVGNFFSYLEKSLELVPPIPECPDSVYVEWILSLADGGHFLFLSSHTDTLVGFATILCQHHQQEIVCEHLYIFCMFISHSHWTRNSNNIMREGGGSLCVCTSTCTCTCIPLYPSLPKCIYYSSKNIIRLYVYCRCTSPSCIHPS